MQPAATRQASRMGSVQHAAPLSQLRFGMAKRQKLGKFFRADPGPFQKHPLKMIRADMHRRRDLFQRWLVMQMLCDKVYRPLNAVIINIGLLLCHRCSPVAGAADARKAVPQDQQ